MKQNYALHKRFLSDVDKIINRDDNIEKIMVYAMNYLSLRQIHSDEISNRDLIEVTRKVSFTDYEVPDIYREMIEELTSQEFVFRIKRVKYIKNTRDSIAIISSPLLMKVGKYLMNSEISSDALPVDEEPENKEYTDETKYEDQTETLHEEETITENTDNTDNKESINKSESSENKEPSVPSDISNLKEIWHDPDLRIKWLLDNMKYKNRDYDYERKDGYTPEEIANAIGRNVLSVKHHIRKYLRDKKKEENP